MKLSWHKQLPRLRPLIGLFVIVASIVVNISNPYTVNAATGYSALKVAEKVKLYEGYMALSQCFNSAALPETKVLSFNSTFITASGVASFTWFKPMGLNGGYLLVSGDGVAKCDGGWVKETVNTLGWSSGTDAIKAFGFTADSSGDFYPPSNSKQSFQRAANSFFGGSAPSLTDEMKYILYYSTFTGECGVTDLGPSAGASSDNLAIANSNGGARATIVSPAGVTEEHLFKLADRGKRVAVDVTPSGNNADNTCGEIATNISKYAAAYAAYINNPLSPDKLTDIPKTSTSSQTDHKVTCAIDGVGWLVCPVMTFMANVVDKAYGVVSAMLTVNAFSTTNNAIMLTAWGNMRNLANVAFVIAFLVVVYSQVTGAGISNYGLKRMLPRIIVAAILVNLSFWLCALAVDASNIVGSSMRDLIQGAGGVNQADIQAAKIQSAGATGVGWVGIVGGILSTAIIGGAALYVGLAALLPALISALFVIVTVLLVLALRQALIILLVVISPLAFVAYLLPNTNEWFTKWRKLFVALLLMYPVAGILFGASALASTIVQNGAAGGTGAGAEGIKVAVQIMGALLQILPLVLLPTLMKTSAGVLGKFGGMINNPNKGPFDRMKKGADNLSNRQRDRRAIRAMNNGKVIGGSQFRRQAKREAIDASLKRERNSQAQKYVAREAVNDDGSVSKFGKQLAGAGPLGGGADAAAIQRALASATVTIDKATAEEVEAESVMVRSMDATALKAEIAGSSSDARKAAAIQRLIKVSDPGGPDGYASEINTALSSSSDVVRRAAAEALGRDGPASLKASDIDRFATGSHTTVDPVTGAVTQNSLEQVIGVNVTNGVLSQEKMVDSTPGDLDFAFNSTDLAGKQKMVDTAAALKANDVLKGKIKHNAKAIDNLSTAKAPSTP